MYNTDAIFETQTPAQEHPADTKINFTKRAEAHFRYNRLTRLWRAYLQASSQILPDRSNLPLEFSYEEGNPPLERLYFRLWDRRSFILDPEQETVYAPRTQKNARYGSEQFSDERNELFLEFVKAKRLEGDALPEGFWFTDLLKFGLLGSKPSKGNAQEVAMRQVWLRQWGYGEENPESLSRPFITAVPGLLAWPQGTTRGGKGSTGRFIAAAQRRTEKVFIPVKNLEVTGYYSEMPEYMQVEQHSSFVAWLATQINVREAILRSPEEIQKQAESARKRVGLLVPVCGGDCTLDMYCPNQFDCIHCPAKAPDPEKWYQVEEKQRWAVERLAYYECEGLVLEAEKMQQLIRACDLELNEMQMIIAYRKDESRVIQIQPRPKRPS